MTIELSNYWAKLTGAVTRATWTPSHEPALTASTRISATGFIGDITHAPVIILDNNGGYGPHITPGEFPDSKACDEFRQMLAAPRPVDPAARSMSLYYLQRNYSPWLISGEAALVNGLAYRSVDGNTLGVGKLTKALPSAQFHRNWLREILAPLAARGERFIVVHRWGRWKRCRRRFAGAAFCGLFHLPDRQRT